VFRHRFLHGFRYYYRWCYVLPVYDFLHYYQRQNTQMHRSDSRPRRREAGCFSVQTRGLRAKHGLFRSVRHPAQRDISIAIHQCACHLYPLLKVLGKVSAMPKVFRTELRSQTGRITSWCAGMRTRLTLRMTLAESTEVNSGTLTTTVYNDKRFLV